MTTAKKKDLVLKKLRENGFAHPIEFNLDTSDFFEIFNEFRFELRHDGMVSIDEGQEERHGMMLDYLRVRVTDFGMTFLNNGGYTAKRRKECIDMLWNRGNILVAFFALIVSVISLRNSNADKAEQIDQAQIIDSLKRKIYKVDSSVAKLKIELDSLRKRK